MREESEGKEKEKREERERTKRGKREKKRRKSFCDRMEGMKRKMTNIKKKNDPNSRINKALKRWRC